MVDSRKVKMAKQQRNMRSFLESGGGGGGGKGGGDGGGLDLWGKLVKKGGGKVGWEVGGEEVELVRQFIEAVFNGKEREDKEGDGCMEKLCGLLQRLNRCIVLRYSSDQLCQQIREIIANSSSTPSLSLSTSFEDEEEEEWDKRKKKGKKETLENSNLWQNSISLLLLNWIHTSSYWSFSDPSPPSSLSPSQILIPRPFITLLLSSCSLFHSLCAALPRFLYSHSLPSLATLRTLIAIIVSLEGAFSSSPSSSYSHGGDHDAGCDICYKRFRKMVGSLFTPPSFSPSSSSPSLLSPSSSSSLSPPLSSPLEQLVKLVVNYVHFSSLLSSSITILKEGEEQRGGGGGGGGGGGAGGGGGLRLMSKHSHVFSHLGMASGVFSLLFWLRFHIRVCLLVQGDRLKGDSSSAAPFPEYLHLSLQTVEDLWSFCCQKNYISPYFLPSLSSFLSLELSCLNWVSCPSTSSPSSSPPPSSPSLTSTPPTLFNTHDSFCISVRARQLQALLMSRYFNNNDNDNLSLTISCLLAHFESLPSLTQHISLLSSYPSLHLPPPPPQALFPSSSLPLLTALQSSFQTIATKKYFIYPFFDAEEEKMKEDRRRVRGEREIRKMQRGYLLFCLFSTLFPNFLHNLPDCRSSPSIPSLPQSLVNLVMVVKGLERGGLPEGEMGRNSHTLFNLFNFSSAVFFALVRIIAEEKEKQEGCGGLKKGRVVERLFFGFLSEIPLLFGFLVCHFEDVVSPLIAGLFGGEGVVRALEKVAKSFGRRGDGGGFDLSVRSLCVVDEKGGGDVEMGGEGERVPCLFGSSSVGLILEVCFDFFFSSFELDFFSHIPFFFSRALHLHFLL